MTSKTLGAASLALAALAVAPATALADETTCRGALGAVTVDDLRVPSGATCDLQGTTIKGQLKVETAATLRASGLRLTGNLQAEGAARVQLASSTVGGSIQVVQGGGADVQGNAVTGDIQFFTNRGGVLVARNTVDGNLQCKENAPAPTGGGNVVQGNAEDQCAALAGGDPAQAGPGAAPAPTPVPPAGADDDDDDRIAPSASRVGVGRGARTLALPVRCTDDDGRCTGTAAVRRAGKTLARGSYSVAASTKATMRMTLTRAGRAALRRKGALRVQLRAADATRSFVLVRR